MGTRVSALWCTGWGQGSRTAALPGIAPCATPAPVPWLRHPSRGPSRAYPPISSLPLHCPLCFLPPPGVIHIFAATRQDYEGAEAKILGLAGESVRVRTGGRSPPQRGFRGRQGAVGGHQLPRLPVAAAGVPASLRRPRLRRLLSCSAPASTHPLLCCNTNAGGRGVPRQGAAPAGLRRDAGAGGQRPARAAAYQRGRARPHPRHRRRAAGAPPLPLLLAAGCTGAMHAHSPLRPTAYCERRGTAGSVRVRRTQAPRKASRLARAQQPFAPLTLRTTRPACSPCRWARRWRCCAWARTHVAT